MASGNSDSRILEQRRCLVLAAIGSTAEKMPSNSTLKALMNAGLLVTIKSWLDDILASKVGGMDLLLHLLSNIIPLPVTKDMVTTSRLGKTVSSVEKHSICVGSGNESAIKSRIQQVKERWSASVKALKNVSLVCLCHMRHIKVYQDVNQYFFVLSPHRAPKLPQNDLQMKVLLQQQKRQSARDLHYQIC